jgi:crossover junction endodeoxyribonuclease RuvC
MSATVVRILGIDPGVRVTGFGVVDKLGAEITYVASGCIRTPAVESLPERLAVILKALGEVIAAHRPREVALEKVFVNVNPASTLALGQARGTAICAAVSARLPIAEYTALQVKQAVVGTGHARKEQVQEMVKRLLRLSGVPSADAADALACAICHAHGAQALWGLAGRSRYERASPLVLPEIARTASGSSLNAGFRVRRGRVVGSRRDSSRRRRAA